MAEIDRHTFHYKTSPAEVNETLRQAEVQGRLVGHGLGMTALGAALTGIGLLMENGIVTTVGAIGAGIGIGVGLASQHAEVANLNALNSLTQVSGHIAE